MKCVTQEDCGCFVEMLHYQVGQQVPTTENCQSWYVQIYSTHIHVSKRSITVLKICLIYRICTFSSCSYCTSFGVVCDFDVNGKVFSISVIVQFEYCVRRIYCIIYSFIILYTFSIYIFSFYSMYMPIQQCGVQLWRYHLSHNGWAGRLHHRQMFSQWNY